MSQVGDKSLSLVSTQEFRGFAIQYHGIHVFSWGIILFAGGIE